jgi:DNA-binding response OmpR family regulator
VNSLLTDLNPEATRVLLVEPNPALRSAIATVLDAENYAVEPCDSLEQVRCRAADASRVIALIAWQSMDGLLAEERREHLVELTRDLRLVVMIPRRWARLLEPTDLGMTVAGLIPKPFEADELLGTLERALLPDADA